MEEAMAARYWCHQCFQVITPIMEVEIKCPFCQGGFVEEMSGGTGDGAQDMDSNFQSDRAPSLWAPILLGMMGNPRRRRRLGHFEFDEEDGENSDGEARHGGDMDLDRELESIMRSRRRSSATILQLLQGIRDGMASETDNSENDRDRDSDRNRNRDRERERLILINPFNQTIIVQGGQNQNTNHIGSIGDYFSGPGLDLLLQHLAENDPNRYGTPPAQKEAIEAMPTVKIKENLQCSVCLDDFEVGGEAKEMPYTKSPLMNPNSIPIGQGVVATGEKEREKVKATFSNTVMWKKVKGTGEAEKVLVSMAIQRLVRIRISVQQREFFALDIRKWFPNR
ncbi:E3 ubiquitin-protein ligase RING1 [Hibiscus syriacus]|uniref:RING-type E3 ubiquitin transferase n=1 Tax=Hibiscus syriacus TaxID=106335 RepID=A0A6A3AQP9_HIBSY|nr:E3 ubiquitin-protein ligase RING1 [Hibiscus syriacus]